MEYFDTVTHDINLCRDFGKKTKVLFLKYSFIFFFFTVRMDNNKSGIE